MKLAKLAYFVQHGSLWVRRSIRCMDCDETPTWLALYFLDEELSAEWHCAEHVDMAWVEDPQIAENKGMILAIEPGARDRCLMRPQGSGEPLCGNPEEYLALYLAAIPEDVRIGPTCRKCFPGFHIAEGEVRCLEVQLGTRVPKEMLH